MKRQASLLAGDVSKVAVTSLSPVKYVYAFFLELEPGVSGDCQTVLYDFSHVFSLFQ